MGIQDGHSYPKQISQIDISDGSQMDSRCQLNIHFPGQCPPGVFQHPRWTSLMNLRIPDGGYTILQAPTSVFTSLGDGFRSWEGEG